MFIFLIKNSIIIKIQYVFLIFISFIYLTFGLEDQEYFASFNTRLRNTFDTWNWDELTNETYFTSLSSNPSPTVYPQEEGITEVSIRAGEQEARPEGNNRVHAFTIGNSSLTIDFNQIPLGEVTCNQLLQNDQLFPIRVLRQDQVLNLRWNYREEKKRFMRATSDFAATVQAAREGYWYRRLIATSELPPSPIFREGLRLEVSVEYRQKHPLDLKGMVISYKKDRHKTGIFFDIIDPLDQTESKYLTPFAPDAARLELLDHERIETNNNNIAWYRVLDGCIWKYPTKQVIYKIFSSEQIRSQWIPADKQFVKYPAVTTYVPLPAQYENILEDESRKTPSENQPVKIVSQVDSTKYFSHFSGTQQLDSDYLYSNGHGKFFPTRHFKEQWTDARNNTLLEVRYLHKSTPEIQFKSDVRFLNSSTWPQGIYRAIRTNGNRETWRLESPVNFEEVIEFTDDERFWLPGVNIDQQTAQTLQRFTPVRHLRFPLGIGHVTTSACIALKEFLKLTGVNLSSVNLGANVTWPQLFESIGNLTRLTYLDLSNNKFKPEHLAPLDNCLQKLTSLKELRVQGQELIWLDPRHFNTLCGILSKTRMATPLRILHIDNLPGEMHYPYKAGLIPLLWIPTIIDAIATSDPKDSINPAAINLISLSHLTSLTLYERSGDTIYNYKKQDVFEIKLKELAVQQGRNNLQTKRVNL